MTRGTNRIAVGMSGGVDSTAAALLLVEAGHDVVGVTAQMTTEYSRCCSDADTERAAQVCAALGIEHHVIDVRDAFASDVIAYFTEDYLAGRTPSPCVICNRAIKFGALLDAARLEFGASCLATGHYVRAERAADGSIRLLRGQDRHKDQSYFLARLTQPQLGVAVFPLGRRTKPEIGALVAAQGLATRQSRESQELCFVTECTHGEWIDLRSFAVPGEGDIVDTDGCALGRHRGIHHYTVGQRKGLGVATGTPVYVTAIDAAANRLVVGSRAEAMALRMILRDVRWIREADPVAELRADVQLRYKHSAAPATIACRGAGNAEVAFDEPQFAIAPGQLAVFYDGDEVVGSGWIVRSCEY